MCGPIMAPMNGFKSTSDINCGTTVVFDCNPGYELIGSNNATCLQSGSWKDGSRQCRRELTLFCQYKG